MPPLCCDQCHDPFPRNNFTFVDDRIFFDASFDGTSSPAGIFFPVLNIKTCVPCARLKRNELFQGNTLADHFDAMHLNATDRQPQDDSTDVLPAEYLVEFCALCNQTTPYNVRTSVHHRDNYVPGLGQLCADCVHTVHGMAPG